MWFIVLNVTYYVVIVAFLIHVHHCNTISNDSKTCHYTIHTVTNDFRMFLIYMIANDYSTCHYYVVINIYGN